MFAAGIILHELLAGAPLFRRDSEYASLMAVLTAPVPSVRTLRPEVPKSVDAIVTKALQRQSDARFSSAQEMQLAIEQALVAMGAASTSTHLARWIDGLPKAADGRTPTQSGTSETQDVLDFGADDEPDRMDKTIITTRAENE